MKNKIFVFNYFIGERYHEYFEGFYESFSKNFCRDSDVVFGIVTDNPNLTQNKKNCLVKIVDPTNIKLDFWSLKYYFISLFSEEILNFNYTFILNGNALCVREVSTTDICRDKLLITLHGFHNGEKDFRFNGEKNSIIEHVLYETDDNYYQPGFSGGPTLKVLEMTTSLSSFIFKDLSIGNFIPYPRDEIYFNYYIHNKLNKDDFFFHDDKRFILPVSSIQEIRNNPNIKICMVIKDSYSNVFPRYFR